MIEIQTNTLIEDKEMNDSSVKRKRKIVIITASVVLTLAMLTGVCAIYLGDYYRADHEAIGAFLPQGTTWKEEAGGMVVFRPDDADMGLIFYPGGKVEYTAYIPLMQACAEEGILCVLVEMPFHLAVLDVNAADGIREEYPEIEDWYIGGHSLGGSMAASYAASHTDDFAGLVLLGAYSTADLSESNLAVLSVYGSEDTVMNREKYEAYKSHLPRDLVESVIDGGCHAYFGMYGAQDGDGTPGITNEEQIAYTADAIGKMMTKNGQTNTYRQISMDEAAAMMARETDYIILDVRRPDEFTEGHIPNAINVANETIGTAEIPELPDKEQLIMVYCRSGRRSKEASEKLVKLGYTNIVEFGGILDWMGEIVTE